MKHIKFKWHNASKHFRGRDIETLEIELYKRNNFFKIKYSTGDTTMIEKISLCNIEQIKEELSKVEIPNSIEQYEVCDGWDWVLKVDDKKLKGNCANNDNFLQKILRVIRLNDILVYAEYKLEFLHDKTFTYQQYNSSQNDTPRNTEPRNGQNYYIAGKK